MRKDKLLLYILFLVSTACTTNESVKEQPILPMNDFGSMPDGTVVIQYTISNKNGIEMKVINYGGIITNLRIPDRDGNFADVVLGYDNLEGYLEATPYFGAIIGRYGNRIARGEFELDGQKYSLAKNNIGNHLHGGIVGFDKVVWNAEPFINQNSSGIIFTYTSKDMEEGYPGNLQVKVTYTLNDNDELIFVYEATTDKATVINLTNHAYYNLTGLQDDILGQELTINSEMYLPVDSTLIPLQPDSVVDTPFDFRSAKLIGQEINEDNIQLKNGLGYDHCWILKPSEEPLNFAASLHDPASGRFMEIYTTEPAIQFYSGNFLDGTITGKDGIIYNHRTGLCLETEHYPDSPNRPDFPNTVLRPAEVYKSKTLTKFSTK